MTSQIKIAISAGELSGDEYGADVVAALKDLNNKIELRGMGGSNLRKAGVDTVVDSEKSASVMGFLELFGSISKIFAALSELKKLLKSWKPDLLILIDYPDFNLRLAKYAHKLGVPVLYYIAPTVWAWRPGRAKILERYVDCLAAIYPFEKDEFKKLGFNRTVYVGHPVADRADLFFKNYSSHSDILKSIGVETEAKLVALLPGSRKHEVETHLPVIVKGFLKLKEKHNELQGILPVAPSIDEKWLKDQLPADNSIVVTKTDALQVMFISDAGVIKSGTSNLQAAFCGLPFFMFYVASKTSAFIVRRFVRIKEYSIVNVLKAGTVPELTQEDVTASNLARELEQVLFNESVRSKMESNFKELSRSLRAHDKLACFSEADTVAKRVARLALKTAVREKLSDQPN